jgi:phospholipid/cholesterol/gamma-HCH transport system substrate-binding protein
MGSHVRVGALVLVALLIFMVTIFSLGQRERLWERKVTYEIHFSTTSGLQEGAPVSLSGVPVGSVTDMELPADPAATYIRVEIEVTGRVAPRIRENSLAAIRTLGLLGDRYVYLTPGSKDAPLLAPGALITSVDPLDYEAVLGQGGDIVANVVEVTASLRDVLQAIQRGEGLLGAMLRNREFGESTLQDLGRSIAEVRSTAEALARVVRRIDQGEGVLGRLARDSPQNRALLASLDRSARRLDELSARLGRGEGALGRLLADDEYARRVFASLDRTLANLDAVSGKLARGEGTLGKLINDPDLYDETKGLVGATRRSWLLRLLP